LYYYPYCVFFYFKLLAQKAVIFFTLDEASCADCVFDAPFVALLLIDPCGLETEAVDFEDGEAVVCLAAPVALGEPTAAVFLAVPFCVELVDVMEELVFDVTVIVEVAPEAALDEGTSEGSLVAFEVVRMKTDERAGDDGPEEVVLGGDPVCRVAGEEWIA
jgi:hypothetical protein